MRGKQVGYGIGILLVLSVIAYLGLKMFVENEAETHIRQWAEQTGTLADFSYDRLDVGLIDRTARVSRVSFRIRDTNSPIAVDELILYAFDINHEFPTFMHVEMKGIHIGQSHSFLKGAAPLMNQLGYGDITADLAYAYRLDPIKKNLEIETIDIRISDAGRLQLTARLNNLDPAIIQSVPNNPFMLISAVSAVAISGMTVRFEDHSLTGRLVQWGARQSGQSEDQFLSGIVQQLNQEIQKQQPPAAKERLQAIEQFIKKPGVIELAVSPSEPIPIMRLIMAGSAEQWIDLLNITVNYRTRQP
jgi:hypothetical protein